MLLADFFLGKYSRQQGKSLQSFQPGLIQFMRNWVWKGNVRELENFIKRLVTLTPQNVVVIGEKIIPSDLKSEYQEFELKQKMMAVNKPFKTGLKECEEQILRQALVQHQWNQSKAARSLKISEQMIRYRMKKLGIAREGS